MSDLFSSLTSAARSLDAQRLGLDVAGQNIANVNTPGYARRVVDLVAVAPAAPGTPGRGVEAAGIRALRDRLLERRLQQELPSERREAAIAETLSIVEATLGQPGASIDGSLQRFFDAFARLAEDPTSSVARQEVVLQGESIAADFRNMASRLDSARHDVNRHITAATDSINSLVTRIAALNQAIGTAGSAEASLHARDDQARLVRELSELVDVRALERSDGGVDLSIGSGRALVVGTTAYAVTATPAAPSGLAQLTLGGATITSEISGGRLGGLLQARDVKIPDYQARLDTIAYELATRVNALHTAGYDQTGVDAGDFFAFSTALIGSAGAAAALIVESAVAADPRRVAAASIAQAGDNQTAKAITSLRDDRVLDSNTATLADGWGQLVYRVGRDARAAAAERDSRREIVRQVDALRDEVSGVSLDEEAMHLLKFQRAYEANARFFRTIDDMLQTLLNVLVR